MENPLGYEIAIPSYKRTGTLKKKTLRMLKEAGFPANIITVFVADAEEKLDYYMEMPDDFRPHIVVGRPGINKQREFIHEYYRPGERVVCFDDDVSRVKTLYPGVPLPTLLGRMFELAAAEGCRLVGVYPSDNGLSMKDRAVRGRVYCIGSMFLMFNWRGSVYPDATTEDFTRSLLCWHDGKSVLRFEGVAPTTRYFKEAGGLQTYRTPEIQEQEMKRLVEKYPEDVVLRKKHHGYTDVRFRRLVEKIIPSPFSDSNPAQQ